MGTAYVVRYRIGAHLGTTAAAIGACYLALALGSLFLLGINREGALGAAGMFVPAFAAFAVVGTLSDR